MAEKEQIKKSKNSSLAGKWLGPLLILLILFVTVFFLFLHFSPSDKETFQMRKKSDNEIEIYGLSEEEVSKINWQKGADYTNYHTGKNKQYRLYGEGKNFFKRLIGKPTVYDAVCPLNHDEVRDKKIDFVSFSNKKEVKIPKTNFFLRYSMFEEKGWGILDILQFLFYVLLAIVALASFDMIFGTNFIGIISYPFRG